MTSAAATETHAESAAFNCPASPIAIIDPVRARKVRTAVSTIAAANMEIILSFIASGLLSPTYFIARGMPQFEKGRVRMLPVGFIPLPYYRLSNATAVNEIEGP